MKDLTAPIEPNNIAYVDVNIRLDYNTHYAVLFWYINMVDQITDFH